MRLPSCLISLLLPLLLRLPTADSAPTTFQTSLLSPLEQDQGFKIPTRYESTVLARRLLALSSTGVLATIFPPNASESNPRLPTDLSHTPIALPDYLATCEESTHPGDPTLLALTVSTSTRNALAGSNVSLSLSWWDGYSRLTHREPWSAANLPRASLIGYLEEIPDEEVADQAVVACYTAVHRDSVLWLPGDKKAAHAGIWMRMVVQQVYWIGGFGDRAFIGWFDPGDWKRVTASEWKAVKLPGEGVDAPNI